MTTETIAPVQLLAQADLLMLASELLRRPGCANDIAFCTENDANETIHASGLSGADSLLAFLNDVRERRLQTGDEAWSDEYHRLFEGSMACPANESTYVRRDKGAIIADINGFYHAFGFRIDQTKGEKPDHIAAELEYLAMLLVRRATALTGKDADGAEVCARAFAMFADDHISEWLGLLAERLFSVTRLPLYESIAAVLACIWKNVAEFHGVRPAGESAAVPIPDEEAELWHECGPA